MDYVVVVRRVFKFVLTSIVWQRWKTMTSSLTWNFLENSEKLKKFIKKQRDLSVPEPSSVSALSVPNYVFLH